jgi:2-dehydro-3-deoxyphosphogluconate aldolase/(4S)-4-hydroxy-2-oxoglutarate aldolase
MTDAIALRTGPVADAIRTHRLIAILRRVEPQQALLQLVDELADAGVRVIEITFDSPSAATDVAVLRRRLDGRSDGPFVLGAGTIMSPRQLDAARAAGADFGVSPVGDLELLRNAIESDFPFLAGGMTPTELHAAWSAGATFVKLFPASAVGPQMIREVLGPLADLQIIPTGGVDADNAQSFLDAGAVAVGFGGALTRATPQARRFLITQVARIA